MKKKVVALGLGIIMGLTLVGCEGSFMKDVKEIWNYTGIGKDYKKAALEHLEERYGKKFEIMQEGGSFAATSHNIKRFVCNPTEEKSKYCYVMVDNDLGEVTDNYLYRESEEKFVELIEDYSKSLFGDDIIIKIYQDGIAYDYNEKEIDPVKFMQENKTGYVINLFIKSDGDVNRKEEAEKIYKFAENILNQGIKNNSFMSFWYINSDEYEKVNEKYPDLSLHNGLSEYYMDSENTLNAGSCLIESGGFKTNLEEIEEFFEEINNGNK